MYQFKCLYKKHISHIIIIITAHRLCCIANKKVYQSVFPFKEKKNADDIT